MEGIGRNRNALNILGSERSHALTHLGKEVVRNKERREQSRGRHRYAGREKERRIRRACIGVQVEARGERARISARIRVERECRYQRRTYGGDCGCEPRSGEDRVGKEAGLGTRNAARLCILGSLTHTGTRVGVSLAYGTHG